MYYLNQIAPVVNGILHGDDVIFNGVSTDSRQLSAGDLFVALIGEHFDAHDFLAQAQQKGAVAALVSKRVDIPFPQIEVKDTLIALGQLAAWHRQHFAIPVIGLTGSCGKTTVKTMIANILQEVAPTLASIGNLNNAIGMPLCLLKLTSEHKFAVLEMGADHAGEIAYLCDLARPAVGLITCVHPVHVKKFGSVDAIAQAKGEIYEALPVDGIAIMNADDPYYLQWRDLITTQSIVTFGLHSGMVTAKEIQKNAQGEMDFILCIDDEEVPVHLELLGEHNVMNALAAAATTRALGIPVSAIVAGLTKMQPVKGRLMRRRGYLGALLLDDHYNSNPAALQAALKILGEFEGKKLVVMGNMSELEPDHVRYHELAAQWLREAGVDLLFGFGELTQFTVAKFGEGATYFDSHDALAAAVRQAMTADSTVLIKGSRGMKLEKVVEKLL